jgi:hypothetical protein
MFLPHASAITVPRERAGFPKKNESFASQTLFQGNSIRAGISLLVRAVLSIHT